MTRPNKSVVVIVGLSERKTNSNIANLGTKCALFAGTLSNSKRVKHHFENVQRSNFWLLRSLIRPNSGVVVIWELSQ